MVHGVLYYTVADREQARKRKPTVAEIIHHLLRTNAVGIIRLAMPSVAISTHASRTFLRHSH